MATPRSVGLTSRALDFIEWIGNKLPDPVFIFLGCALLVMAMSAVGSAAGWNVAVVKVAPGEAGERVRLVETGEVLAPRSILSREGGYWALSSMVTNFTKFAPLGVILVCMLGVGVAEKTGLFEVGLRWVASGVPRRLLTPTVIFIGTSAHVAADAGFVILPPLAGALYAAVGRSPLAGIAAVFAGIAGGFSANIFLAAIDAVMAGLTGDAARILDPAYQVSPACNWAFLAASAVLLTLLGWAVTAWIVEPRLARLPADEGGPAGATGDSVVLEAGERRSVRNALIAEMVALGAVAGLILIPGAPLHGVVNPDDPKSAARWMGAIVPIIFFLFLTPGLVFGVSRGSIRSQRDVAACFTHAMATMAPVIALYFFAAQFIEYLNYSNLGKMLAFTGGKALVEAGLPSSMLLLGVVVLTMVVNLFISSMSAKWTMLAPILVPMLMMVGLSPELTQVANRVGDSVTNIVTPLNPYMIIVIVAMQRYSKKSGMGSVIALMTPYCVAFAVVWTLFLLGWHALGIPLGPGGPLEYAAR